MIPVSATGGVGGGQGAEPIAEWVRVALHGMGTLLSIFFAPPMRPTA